MMLMIGWIIFCATAFKVVKYFERLDSAKAHRTIRKPYGSVITERKMTMPNNFGKPGTVTEAEFTALSDAVGVYGALVVALKIAKFCSNRAAALSHEYGASALAAAFTGYASKITSSVRVAGPAKISSEFFTTLGNMVNTYGPEVVLWKLAKIAGRNGNSAEKTLLAGLFPKKSGSGSAPMGAVRPGAAAGGRRLGY